MSGRPALSGTRLPHWLENWFSRQGWIPHHHQLAMLAAAGSGESTLLLAPTGGGKTLGGFLGTIVELAERPATGLHTLYVSPLKALAVDVHRNLLQPIADMQLDISAETRTGDTPASKRQRQRRRPPNILLTTPESLALLLSYSDAERLFRPLACIVIDELHALVSNKRGELLALGLARLGTLAPAARRVGLSATAAFPDDIAAFLASGSPLPVQRVHGDGGKPARAEIMIGHGYLPWSGHMGLHAADDIYNAIRNHRTTLVFVNTRAQAELLFRALWRLNEDHLEIALHHGSLAVEQRRRVEAAMAGGRLRAVVATSSLDLGIDWAAIDLVIQVGAPKGASRLLQRIGRANHRLDVPSRALLVPGNRFEVLECQAALSAIRTGDLDGEKSHRGGLDVLAQHILGMACSKPFQPDDLYREVCQAAPYRDLTRAEFDDTLGFVLDGGYALRVYDRFRRLKITEDGRVAVADRRVAHSYRMNVGTIVESVTLKVRLQRRRFLGEIEEHFVRGLRPGDTFAFSGRLLRFDGLRETVVEVSPGHGNDPKVPAYSGRPTAADHQSRRRRPCAA